jgi:hypothetical protein
MLFDQQPESSAAGEELNLLPPPELNVSLWRSLFVNLRDSILPERLPPLRLTSRPIQVGMLIGDIMELPWYRTILANLGDAISPETLPPLQLESQPVDVELISDQPSWWRSLLRNLADSAAPERLPALHLTSSPVNPNMASEVLVTPRWSSVIPTPVSATPKVLLRDPWSASRVRTEDQTEDGTEDRPVPVAAPLRTIFLQLPSLDPPVDDESERQLVKQIRRQIRSSRIREIIWINVVVAEVIALMVLLLIPH